MNENILLNWFQNWFTCSRTMVLPISSSSTSSSTITSGINFEEPEGGEESLQPSFRSKDFDDPNQSKAPKYENQSLPVPSIRLPSQPTTPEATNSSGSRNLHRYALQDFSPRTLGKNNPNRHHIHSNTITCRPISDTSSIAQSSVSSSSSSLETDPLSPTCKICHLNSKDGDPLISPCKCSGTMQYIHCGCLMVCLTTVFRNWLKTSHFQKWLEISSKKSRKPLSCELCKYQYHWHKKFKVRCSSLHFLLLIQKFSFKVKQWQFPHCSRKDRILHLIFIISVIVMISCATLTVLCFKNEPTLHHRSGISLKGPTIITLHNNNIHLKSDVQTPSILSATSGHHFAVPGISSGSGSSTNIGLIRNNELTRSEIITLICGIFFFLSFFMAMYVEVKARNTIYKLIVKFIYLNQQWYIDEYEKEPNTPVDVWKLIYTSPLSPEPKIWRETFTGPFSVKSAHEKSIENNLFSSKSFRKLSYNIW